VTLVTVSTVASRKGEAFRIVTAGAAVAVASSATLRRMYERKEDMSSALGGAVVARTGSVPTASMPTPAVEVVVSMALATVSTVASRKGEAFRVVTVEVTGAVASSVASEGTVGKWEAELSSVPVSR
jgi:hypothetical protein